VLAALLGILAFACGCKTVSHSDVQAFAAGVTAAKTQSGEAFRSVTDLIAQDQLEDTARATNLTEALFAPVLDAQNVAVWDGTLAKLESYGTHLQMLTGPKLTESYEQEAESLGNDLQNLGKRLADEHLLDKAPNISPGIATAVTELGRLIIRAKAQHDARRIATSANSNIVATLHLMAASIGETSQTGLRGTVRQHWLGRLGEKKVEFRRQTESEAKKRVATEFLSQMQERDTQDAVLASLRRSLLSLASLHQALSNRDALTARQLAQAISDEIKAAREMYAQFKEKLKH
jgi:hypothetical protein